jgi:signal transduction histidine kinase
VRDRDDLAWGPPWAGGGPPWAAHGGPPPLARYLAAGLVAVVQVAGTFGAAHGQPDRRPVDGLAVALLLVAPVAIVLLRRWTTPAVLAVGAATGSYFARDYPFGPVFLGLVIALVASVARGHRLAAWTAAALVLAGHVADVALLHQRWSWQSFGGVLAWTLVVLAIAEVVRSWRERAATFREAARETRRRQAGEERLRIAQELHDVVAHHMSLINVQAGVALHLAEKQRPEQAEPALRAIKDASKEALTELRSLIDVLRADDAPAPRTPQATLARLDDIVDRSRHAGLDITRTVTGRPRALSAALELAAYRIVHESVTNIVRHAHARRATVDLDYGDTVLTVRVEDDGTGGPMLRNLKRGNGISGMQERARALGGELDLAPSPLGGLRIEARIPTGEER